MKNPIKCLFFFPVLIILGIFTFSCEDSYEYNDKAPDWLGESIYDLLKNYEEDAETGKQRSFKNLLSIIDEIDDKGVKYAEVLKKTGSKTLFAVDDAAFEAFFSDNEYGVRSMEDFSMAQKRAILFSNILDNAYLLEAISKFSDTPPVQGQVMRKASAWAVLDSLPFETGAAISQNKYWERFWETGVNLLKDGNKWTMLYFTESHMKLAGILNSDFSIIVGKERSENDVYIFDNKVEVGDIACKNGYVNIMEKLNLPADNMAEAIRKNKDTQLFSSFIERYSVPVYSDNYTAEYKGLYPDFGDSIFIKRYFNNHGGSATLSVDPDGNNIDGLLSFDPGQNYFQTIPTSDRTLQTDAGAIFVPSDEALNRYFNEGAGEFLRERYGTWENIPNNVLNLLINNHMRPSLTATVPSKFSTIEDKVGTSLNIHPDDVDYATICSNGVNYIVNKVYVPTEYASVMAPVIFSEETKVFNWAASSVGLQFDLYLLSMENEFSYLVPMDAAFTNYINPVSLARDAPERLKFFYNEQSARINAVAYDLATGDSLRLITSDEIIRGFLQDIMDNHIVVGDIEDGQMFYQTKGGATIKVGSGSGEGLSVLSGGNIEYGEDVRVVRPYSMNNGKTFFLNNVLQTPLQTVLQTMASNDQYREFYQLCANALEIEGFDGNTHGGYIFSNDPTFAGIGMNVSFFSTFNYTIYIPTNDAVLGAINSGKIKRWEDIEAINDINERVAEADKLYTFLRYHFQDNSVYLSGQSFNKQYLTAAKNSSNRFRELKVESDGTDLLITTESGTTAKVVTSNPSLYNIMARDYKFNGRTPEASTTIATSSFAVIHQIDKVLDFE